MSALAVIGGTGLERLQDAASLELLSVTTPFGNATVYRATVSSGEILFLPRHGNTHSAPPHLVNYRANILALKQLGVERIIATNAVGSLRQDLTPGSIAVLYDFIDMTRGRPTTLFSHEENEVGVVVHTDFSEPYCPQLRNILISAAGALGISILDRATYVCVEGPRFESPAEVRMFSQIGGDVVGMTGLPEAVFAREAGLCYAGIAIVTNYGAGLTAAPVEHHGVVSKMAESVATVQSLILHAASDLPRERQCNCSG